MDRDMQNEILRNMRAEEQALAVQLAAEARTADAQRAAAARAAAVR